MRTEVPVLDAEKIKTKCNNLQGEYNRFSKLKSHTEFGWDNETQTVSADPGQWANIIDVSFMTTSYLIPGLVFYPFFNGWATFPMCRRTLKSQNT